MKLLDKIKDGITDFIGFIVVVATLTKLWDKEITWLWDGLIGLGVGLALFLIPDEWIKETIKNFVKKYTNNG